MTLLSFLLIPWIAGLGLSLVTSGMGCFLVWRRLSFFGDALAHSALLGVAISFALGIPLFLGVLILCILIALILGYFPKKDYIGPETSLAILSYGTLALGIIAVSKLAVRIDPASYLFGDILTVTFYDVGGIFAVAALVCAFLYYQWQPLLLITLHPELAQAEGICVTKLQLHLTLVLAMTVAACLKFIGALLVPALLIIPPATAARYAKTPETMVGLTFLFACTSITLGLFLSVLLNTASGAMIIVVALALFSFSRLRKISI